MDGRTPQRPDREVQISAKQSNLTRKHPADKVPQGLLRGRGEGPDLPGGRRCGGTGRTANGRPYGCTDFAPTRRDEHCSSGLCRIDGHEAGGQGGRNCGETGAELARRIKRKMANPGFNPRFAIFHNCSSVSHACLFGLRRTTSAIVSDAFVRFCSRRCA